MLWMLAVAACSGPEPSAPPPEGDADTDTDTDSDTDTDPDTDLDCIASGTHGIEGPPVATSVGEHLTVGDIDGDGNDDLVGLTSLGLEAGSLFARDLDGDGREEVVAGWITDQLSWEEIEPCLGPVQTYTAATVYAFDGTWQPAGAWTFDHRQFTCVPPIAFRIEAAGADILVHDSTAGLWLVPPAPGDLDVTEAATLRVDRGIADAAGGDVDGDGITDAMALRDGVWLLAGDLGDVELEDGELLRPSGTHVSVGDADGDGRDDILVDGSLIDGQGHELASASAWGELVPDLDGDGTAEIADLNVGGATLWLGPVQGTEPPPTLSVVRPYLQALEAGDTDGDGGVEMLLQDDAGDIFSLVVCP